MDPLTMGIIVGVALASSTWAMILYIVKKELAV